MKYCLSPREIPRAEPQGSPEGSGNISSYTKTQVTIQSFSITSTSQYFDKRINIFCDIIMSVANWGEMHSQKQVGFQPYLMLCHHLLNFVTILKPELDWLNRVESKTEHNSPILCMGTLTLLYIIQFLNVHLPIAPFSTSSCLHLPSSPS